MSDESKGFAADESAFPAQKAIFDYLTENVVEFRTLCELRQKGWSSKRGDEYFARQRRTADRGDTKTAIFFFRMMQRIAAELQSSTGGLVLGKREHTDRSVLDFCMAPGGFLCTALRLNPGAHARAYTLAPSDGGHEVLLQNSRNFNVKFTDVTMLAADMGVREVTKDHPDYGKFQMHKEFSCDDLFDLILCDGQVLRTHQRAPYREQRESRRLVSTQLALGLEHVKAGGTMIVLLHKIEAWPVVLMLYMFQRFATIQLFKSSQHHTTRSSAYMIAMDIDTSHPDVGRLITKLKALWRAATFGTDEEYLAAIGENDVKVEQLLVEFGPSLIEMGRSVWDIQAQALARAPFIV